MKTISMILLTSLTLSLAYAMPTTGAKVTRVKQWTTNNASVNFRVAPKTAAYPEDNSRYVRVTTKTEAQQGIVNTAKTYTANSAFDFYNDSNEAEIVFFGLEVCIDHIDDDNSQINDDHYHSQCGYYTETISVPAHDQYSKNFEPEIIAKFDKAGAYRIESRASYFSNTNQKMFFSKSSANITITT